MLKEKAVRKRALVILLLLLASTPPGSRLKQLMTLIDSFGAEWNRGDMQIAMLSTLSNFAGTLFFLALSGYLISAVRLRFKKDTGAEKSTGGAEMQHLAVFLFLFGGMLFKFYNWFEAAIYVYPAFISFFLLVPQVVSSVLNRAEQYKTIILTSGTGASGRFLNSVYLPAFFKLAYNKLPFIAVVIFAVEMFVEFNAGLGSMIKVRAEEWHFAGALLYVIVAAFTFILIHVCIRKLNNVVPLSHSVKEVTE